MLNPLSQSMWIEMELFKFDVPLTHLKLHHRETSYHQFLFFLPSKSWGELPHFFSFLSLYPWLEASCNAYLISKFWALCLFWGKLIGHFHFLFFFFLGRGVEEGEGGFFIVDFFLCTGAFFFDHQSRLISWGGNNYFSFPLQIPPLFLLLPPEILLLPWPQDVHLFSSLSFLQIFMQNSTNSNSTP